MHLRVRLEVVERFGRVCALRHVSHLKAQPLSIWPGLCLAPRVASEGAISTCPVVLVFGPSPCRVNFGAIKGVLACHGSPTAMPPTTPSSPTLARAAVASDAYRSLISKYNALKG
eukprot:1118214-Rhodomonas_salina.1